MKNPLSEEEMREAETQILAEFRKKYNEILACQSIADQPEHSHMIARYAVILMAPNFQPLTPESRRELELLRKLGY